MRPAVRVFLPALLFLACGCILFRSGPTEVDRILPGTTGYRMLPGRISLPQGSHNPTSCGPESLCGSLNYLGIPVSVADVEHEIYNVKIQGSVAPQIVDYARRKGASAKVSDRGGGWPKLLDHVNAGSPVMIEVTLGGQYHYYLVAGINPENRLLVCAHYGDRQLLLSFELLDELWRPTDYRSITFTIPPAEELALQAQECLKAGRYDLAEKLATQALQKEPRQGMALRVLGRIRIEQKKFEEAQDFLERALESMPADDVTLNDLSHTILVRKGDAARAEKLSRGAVAVKFRQIRDLEDERLLDLPGTRARIDEEIADARFELFYYYGTWGQALEANGKPERSVEEREQSLNYAPDEDPDGVARRHVETGLALRALGLKDRALEHFRQGRATARDKDLQKKCEELEANAH